MVTDPSEPDSLTTRRRKAVTLIQQGVEELNDIEDLLSRRFAYSAPHSWVLTVDRRGVLPSGGMDSDVYSVSPEGAPAWFVAALSGEGCSRLSMFAAEEAVSGEYEEDDE